MSAAARPRIRLYTSRGCGYCWAARRLLTSLGIDFDETPLDAEPELRSSLSEANGNWNTVPMIFIGDRFVGGFTDLVRLKSSGRLDTLIADPS